MQISLFKSFNENFDYFCMNILHIIFAYPEAFPIMNEQGLDRRRYDG